MIGLHGFVATLTACSLLGRAEAPMATPAPAVSDVSQPPSAGAPTADARQPATPSTASDWDEVVRTTTVTTTTTMGPVPPPVVTPDSAPPPPPRRRDPAATALIGTGAGLLAAGVISVVLVAGPAALVKRTALRRADDEHALSFTSREARYNRARAADNTMEGAFWFGVSAAVVGVVLLTSGAVRRARGERPARVAPPLARLGAGPGGFGLRF